MIILDMRTVTNTQGLIYLVCLAVMLLLWLQTRSRYSGLFFWVANYFLGASGLILISFREVIPDWASIPLANSLVVGGMVLLYFGLQRFAGKKILSIYNALVVAGFAVFVFIHCYFTYVQPNLVARIANISAAVGLASLLSFILLAWGTKPEIRSHSLGTRIALILVASILVARMAGLALIKTNDFMASGLYDTLTVLLFCMSVVYLAINLILMVNHRLLADVKAQEEKFTIAFHSSPYAVSLTKPDGRIFEVNDGFQNISGYQYAEVIGNTTLDLHLWVRDEDRLAVINELAQGREVHAEEYQFRKKTGEVLNGLFSANLITINNETCILSSIDDITARREAEEALEVSEKKYRDALQSIIVAMSKFNASRDPYTTSHEHRVTELTCAIAAEMGLPQKQIEGIRLSSYIHDSGKLAVPLEILMHQGKLNEIQMAIIRTHPQKAYDTLVDIDLPWPIATTVWQHHERIDGSGYPQGLRDGDMLLEAKILAVADVVEAMASARPFRPALGMDKALEEISSGRGKLYDLAVVDACLKLFKKEGFEFKELGLPDVFQ